MPMAPGSDPKTIAQNIKKAIKEGYEQKQAVAIAIEKARESKKK